MIATRPNDDAGSAMNCGVSRLGDLDRAEFVARFGALYEHSPWVAERVHAAGLEARHEDTGQLHQAFRQAVLKASAERQLALLRAHPQLACGRADLTESSVGEQAGAGLDRCSPVEFEAFTELNQRYLRRFGFPFIVAVRGLNRAQILARFRQRIDNDRETEFRTALEEVCRIGRHRLEDLAHA